MPGELGAYGSEYLEATWEEGWDPGDSRFVTGNGMGPVTGDNLAGVWDVVGDVFEKGAEIVPQILKPQQRPTGEVTYTPSWEAAKDIALREAGTWIAQTPEGQEAIRREAARQAAEKAKAAATTAAPFAIPLLIGGVLLFTMMGRR